MKFSKGQLVKYIKTNEKGIISWIDKKCSKHDSFIDCLINLDECNEINAETCSILLENNKEIHNIPFDLLDSLEYN